MKSDKLRIAIQSNGRLREPSYQFLESLALQFAKVDPRALVVPCLNADIELIYVRHSDISYYVKTGTADLGIVGQNCLYESGDSLDVISNLNFGNCKLVIATPNTSPIKQLSDLNNKRIATSYPNSLISYLNRNGIKAEIITLGGSIEIATIVNIADAICDLTQTGNTLKQNQLTVFATVYESQAVLVKSPLKKSIKSDICDLLMNNPEINLSKNTCNPGIMI